jgi:hypothetical protein
VTPKKPPPRKPTRRKPPAKRKPTRRRRPKVVPIGIVPDPGIEERQRAGLDPPDAPKPNKGGRPKKFTEALRRELVDLMLDDNVSQGAACKTLGIGRTTLHDELGRNEPFAKELERAKAIIWADRVEETEDALYREATEPDKFGKRNVVAMQVLLYNRSPRTWADQRNKAAFDAASGLSVEQARAIVAEVIGVPPEDVEDELARLRKRKARARASDRAAK